MSQQFELPDDSAAVILHPQDVEIILPQYDDDDIVPDNMQIAGAIAILLKEDNKLATYLRRRFDKVFRKYNAGIAPGEDSK